MSEQQEIFDRCVERLKDGKGRAQSPTGICTYKNQDGNKCLVGLFIPDGHPAQNHGGPVDNLLATYPGEFPLISNNRPLMVGLQYVHDGAGNWDDKKFVGWGPLANLAKNFGLKFDAP